jgi:hypothetical protein
MKVTGRRTAVTGAVAGRPERMRLTALFLVLVSAAPASAQQASQSSASDLAKLVQNPLADPINRPVSNETSFPFGLHHQANYVPKPKETPFGDATVRDVLDMKVNVGAGETSGASDVADAALWATLSPNSIQSVYETLATVRADGPNDGYFHYASMTTEVAGWVITRAAGRSCEELASELLWSRLGLQDDIFMPVDPAGKDYSSTGLKVSARDLARIRSDDRQSRAGHRRAGFPSGCDRLPVRIWRFKSLGKRQLQGQSGYPVVSILLVSIEWRRSRLDGARRIRPGIVHQCCQEHCSGSLLLPDCTFGDRVQQGLERDQDVAG